MQQQVTALRPWCIRGCAASPQLRCALVSRWFETTAIILFLNKIDLFADKIKVKDIRQPNPNPGYPDLFSDYAGASSPLLCCVLSCPSCVPACLPACLPASLRVCYRGAALFPDVAHLPCACCFPAGGNNFDAGVAYFTKLFMDRNEMPRRKIFTKATCATDQTNVKTVFESCKTVILEHNLKGSGFM